MKRRIVPLVIVAAIAAGAAVWYFVLRPQRGPSDRLVLSGTIEATTIEVGSEVAGRVTQLPVQRGDLLALGDMIAEVSTDVSEAQLAQATAVSGAARAGETQSEVATQVQAGVLAAQVVAAERKLATVEAQLANVLAGTRPEAIREAEAAVGAAEAQTAAARDQLAKAEAGPREQEIAQARAGVQRAQEAVKAAQAQVDELRAGTRSQDIEQARAALASACAQSEKAAIDARRMSDLHAEGVVSADQLERAQTAARTSAEAARAAQAALDKALAGPRSETIRAAEANLGQARAAQRQAVEQLALLEAGTRAEDIAAARAQVRQAEQAAQAARERLAAARKGPTDEQIRVARRQVDEARAALRVARENARQVRVSQEQIQVARRQAEASEAAATQAALALGKHLVAAPAQGVVDSVNVEAGEVVTPGGSLVTLLDLSDLWATVFVAEPDLPRVMLGQRAEIRVDGWDEPFAARVSWIAQEAEFTPKYVLTHDERTRLVYRVRVRPDDPQGRLKPGMPADVTIFLGEGASPRSGEG